MFTAPPFTHTSAGEGYNDLELSWRLKRPRCLLSGSFGVALITHADVHGSTIELLHSKKHANEEKVICS
jgi:hypothetical protein